MWLIQNDIQPKRCFHAWRLENEPECGMFTVIGTQKSDIPLDFSDHSLIRLIGALEFSKNAFGLIANNVKDCVIGR